MGKTAAGILLYRRRPAGAEVLLVHMGGPFWARKDEGAWSVPKGEFGPGEEPLAAARREFEEETGAKVEGDARPLTPVGAPGGKRVHAFAVEGDFDPAALVSNTFTMEWPKGSGRLREFPEVDRASWFGFAEARRLIVKAQAPLLDELERHLNGDNPGGERTV